MEKVFKQFKSNFLKLHRDKPIKKGGARMQKTEYYQDAGNSAYRITIERIGIRQGK